MKKFEANKSDNFIGLGEFLPPVAAQNARGDAAQAAWGITEAVKKKGRRVVDGRDNKSGEGREKLMIGEILVLLLAQFEVGHVIKPVGIRVIAVRLEVDAVRLRLQHV